MTSQSNNKFNFVDRHTNLPISLPSAINTNEIKLGNGAGQSSQQNFAIAIGSSAGQVSQGNSSVAIGKSAAQSNQSYDAVAIGTETGQTGQQFEGVAIGNRAGKTNQGGQSVAIGSFAGNADQKTQCVAIGPYAGQTNQKIRSVAIGFQAALTDQGDNGVAIGHNAGQTNQGNHAIAIGQNAAQTNQELNAIAIGQNTGVTNQHARTIMLNTSGGTVNSDGTDRIFITPIREVTNQSSVIAKALFHSNTSSMEVLGVRVQVAHFTFTSLILADSDVQFPGLSHGTTFSSIPIMFGSVTDKDVGSQAENILVSFYQVSTTGYTLILKNVSNSFFVSTLNEPYKISVFTICMN